MRRIVVLAVAAMMAVMMMMATSASPAFALPLNRGQLVSAFTQSLHANPPDPILPRGQQVSEFAQSLSDLCTPGVNVDCPGGGGTGHGGGDT